MENIRHIMHERFVGNLIKPFIDECGIIHITYMANALFLPEKWLPQAIDKQCYHSLFGCHVTFGVMALVLVLKK